MATRRNGGRDFSSAPLVLSDLFDDAVGQGVFIVVLAEEFDKLHFRVHQVPTQADSHVVSI